MELLKELASRNPSSKDPFFVGANIHLTIDDLLNSQELDLRCVRKGDLN